MRFSVIIPVYNKANTIQAALESIYAQTIKDFEVIVVDDGSKDDLMEVLERLSAPCIRIIHQENGGVSSARNAGIQNAKGEYVCFLDADDLWKENHLETLSRMITKYPDSVMFVTSHEIVMQKRGLIHSSKYLSQYDDDFEVTDFIGLLNETDYSVVHTNSVCIKRAEFERSNIYFEVGIKIGEDTDVWYRIGLKNRVAISKQETSVYRREFSTATTKGFHVQDWVFFKRSRCMLEDENLPVANRHSLETLLDRYKMTSSREYMMTKNRNAARDILTQVTRKSGLRYIVTVLLTYLPYFVCNKLLSIVERLKGK